MWPKFLADIRNLRRDGPLPTQDISLVYQDGLEVVARKKVSQELPVQRSKRERFVKACNKLGILPESKEASR